jgi:hypothetical protein
MPKAVGIMQRYMAYPVTHWIRTEELAADFETVFSRYLDFAGIDLSLEFRRTNTNEMNYIRDVAFYFTRAEVAALYRANPLWAEVERKVYGSLP